MLLLLFLTLALLIPAAVIGWRGRRNRDWESYLVAAIFLTWGLFGPTIYFLLPYVRLG